MERGTGVPEKMIALFGQMDIDSDWRMLEKRSSITSSFIVNTCVRIEVFRGARCVRREKRFDGNVN